MIGTSFHRILLVGMLLALRALATAQVDTSAYGGPEEVSPYEGETIGPMEEMAPTLEWSAVDSMRNIPSYNTYRSWDTDVIFARAGTPPQDSVTLQLSLAACDHYMPICGRVTSPFGARHGRMHYGVDLKLQHGDPVVSAFDGMVRISRYHPQFGNVVVVRHANGLETLYGHLSARLVSAGDVVQAGEVLGLGGSTGRSTGDHLHFETRYLGEPIDPQMLFDVENGELTATTLLVNSGLFVAFNKARTALRSAKFSTVHKGDTLSSIAHRSGTSVSTLFRLNHLGSRSKLRPGQRIRIL